MFSSPLNRISILLFFIFVSASLFFGGCAYRGRTGKRVISSEVQESDRRIKGDAYLFRLRIKQNNKPTTLKLNIYQSKNELAIFARAYLGKGAFKGRLDGDTLLAYFPMTNEYLIEPLNSLMSVSDCQLTSENEENVLTDLLNNLPDSIKLGEGISIVSDYSNKKHPKFLIKDRDCSWELELTYDRQKNGWRVEKFKFINGEEFSVEGWREKYKGGAKLKRGYFSVDIPDGAVRVRR